MNDCKNCKYTDEYCASGDCNKTQANNLACNKISLTEQWKKGELPVGEYYLLYKDGTTDREYYDWANVYGRVTEKGFSTDPNDIEQVLAPVPSYEVYKELIDGRKLLREYIKDKTNENTQLKELLKGCSIANTALISIMDWLQISVISEQKEHCKKLFENTQELQRQIDEVLK